MIIHFAVMLANLLSTGISQENEGDECIFSYTNSLGVCKKIEECETVRRQSYLNGWVQPTFCSNTYNPFADRLVCCTDDSNILQTPDVSDEQRVVLKETTKRINEIKCEEYSKLVTETVSYLPLQTEEERDWSYRTSKCRYIGTELIIGGGDAELEEFPHMAAIGYTNFDNGYSFNCGGTLVSPKFVLTAAHCSKSTATRIPEPVIVRLGDHNLDPGVEDGAQPIDVPIRKIHIHPNYTSPIAYDDIALLELAAPVPFRSAIRPACLWNQDGIGKNSRAIATGWVIVDTRRGGTRSDVLKKVALDLFENDLCDTKLFTNRYWNGSVKSQMCAGDLAGGNDTCQGDSGGPLQVTSYENKCVFFVMGITSLGRKCGEADQPAIYTRVSEYIDWIESVVWAK